MDRKLIKSFDTPQEMFDYLADMNRQGRTLMERYGLTGDDLGPGTFWMCMSVPDLLIVGRAEDSPYAEDRRPINTARDNGFIYGTWYSVVVPEGEFGSNHFSWCLPITHEQFDSWMYYIHGQEVAVAAGDKPRWTETITCPRCGGPVPRAGAVGMYPGALSRRDNYTYICSECGMKEALEDFSGTSYDGLPYWDTTKEGRYDR